MGTTRESEIHAKSWRGGKKEKGRGFASVLFSCSRFLNSADPTISEPGKGYDFVGKMAKQLWCREMSAISQARLVRGFAPFYKV